MADFTGDGGDNIFTGGSEADNATGGGGNDQLSGNGGNDTLSGDSGADTLNGGDGDDWLYSGTKSPPFNIPYYNNPYTPPVLDTGTEVDTLIGGAGSDRLFAGYGDNVDGGSGTQYGPGDYLYISFQGAPSGVTADFTLATQVIGGGTITGIESVSWIQGSNFADDIRDGGYNGGYNDFTAIFGMGGNDTLTAGYYTGTLDGGEGNDTVDGRGSQYLQFVYGGAGDDTLYTATNTFATALGGDGNDTIYSHGTTYGGAGDDHIVISFSYYPGFVYGDEGNDTIEASTNGASLSGGAGADVLMGNSGADTLASGDFPTANVYPLVPADDLGLEQDVLTGAAGNDLLAIGYGDSADGGADNDTLRLSLGGLSGGATLDTSGIASGLPFVLGGGTIQNIETFQYLRGTNFDDALTIATQTALLTIEAGDGNDTVVSYNSSIDLRGGNGNDFFITGAAGDTFDGGAGIDTIDYRNATAGVTVTLALVAGQAGTGTGGDQIRNVENVNGSSHGDTLNGNDEANFLEGFAGNDTLNGHGGDDKLAGGFGDDSMSGGLGNDQFLVHDTGDQVFEAANQGLDEVLASVSWVLAAGQHVERLVLFGDPSAPLNLTGNELANELVGNAAANILDGGGGTDSMSGGAGNDTYVVDDAGDTASEAAGDGTDTVEASVSFVLGANIENLTLTGTDAIDGTGNASSNTLTGNSGANLLDGGEGHDTLNGGDGQDWLNGGDGSDSLSSNDGHDSLWGGDGSDWLAGGAGDDTIFGGDGTDTVTYAAAQARVEVDLSWLEEQNTRGAGWDTLVSIENLVGSLFGDALTGDTLANRLTGGGGADVLTGGESDDVFAYGSLADSTAADPDLITDFAAGDLLDLSALDADTGTGGDQAFHLGATAGHAGDVVLAFDAGNDRTSVSLFVDGDATADAVIWLSGDHTALTGADFIL